MPGQHPGAIRAFGAFVVLMRVKTARVVTASNWDFWVYPHIAKSQFGNVSIRAVFTCVEITGAPKSRNCSPGANPEVS